MAAPENTSVPTFTGLLRVGQTLSGADGTWTGSPTFAYQWQRAEPVYHEGVLVYDEDEIVTLDWEDISGATLIDYVGVAEDVNHAIRLRVVGTNGDGSATAYSEQADGLLAGIVVGGSFIRGLFAGALQTYQSEDEN